MGRPNAVILNSGGLNSAVAASIAAHDYELAMMYVRIGHRAEERERTCFDKQAEHFKVDRILTTELPHFAAVGAGARVNRKRPIEDVMAMEPDGGSSCYLPGMIGSLLHAAFAWACHIDANVIYLGISENLGPPAPPTSKVFPDYARETVQLCQHAFAVAMPRREITIEVPLLDLNRADVIRLGQRLKSPLELTWSCLSTGAHPCGGCLGCVTRQRGFLDAGVADPVQLAAGSSPARVGQPAAAK